MRWLVVVCALVVCGAVAPPAFATRAPTFRGLTGQDRELVIQAEPEGDAERVDFTWRAKCPSGFRLRAQDASFAPVDGRAVATLRGTGRYRFPDRGGRIALASTRLSGALRGPAAEPARQVWEGTFRAVVSVRRHGRFVERCTLRTRWIAKPEGIGEGRFTMAGGGDWVGSNVTWNYDPTNATISAKGDRRRVGIDIQAFDETNWTADFTAPALNRFTPGQRYTTDFDTPGAATMMVWGDGRGCNSGGSFTIRAIEMDRLRRLMAVTVDFEQYCDGDEGPSRGTIEWRATR
ncbi:MAG TPA: hypothetical protein VF549_02535 [Solirubrobacteraceae bacterium]|jgi:hypothetical protein